MLYTIFNINMKDVNIIYNESCENMYHIPDNSVHLTVTSPPYNIGKDYGQKHDDSLTITQYVNFLEDVIKEIERVTVMGGRIAINVGDIGRNPTISIKSHIDKIASDLNLLNRGNIIWIKSGAKAQSNAWGSWRSPSNPVLIETHEYILVYSKGCMKRTDACNKNKSDIDITGEQFKEYIKSIWNIYPTKGTNIGHPAPFPVELPYRLMLLYTYKGDIVLDPFMGSGTTAIAAQRLGRNYIGYETNKDYKKLAENRIMSESDILL